MHTKFRVSFETTNQQPLRIPSSFDMALFLLLALWWMALLNTLSRASLLLLLLLADSLLGERDNWHEFQESRGQTGVGPQRLGCEVSGVGGAVEKMNCVVGGGIARWA